MLLLATFPSTQAALRAERELAGRVPVELIPVPRQVHHHCGFCLRVGPFEPPEALEALRTLGAEGLWRIVETEPPSLKERRYEPYPQTP